MKKLNIESVNELDPNKVYKIKVGETLLPCRYHAGTKDWYVGAHGEFHASKLATLGCEVYEIEPEPTVVVEFEYGFQSYRVQSNGEMQFREVNSVWEAFTPSSYENALISAFLKKIAELEARGEQ